MSNRVKKLWKPQLLKRELYSEILDHKFTITVTPRTLDLIDAAYGFDLYILTVSALLSHQALCLEMFPCCFSFPIRSLCRSALA